MFKTKLVCAAAALTLAACGQTAGSGGSTPAPAGDASGGAPSATAPANTSDATATGDAQMPRQRVGLWRIAMNMGGGMPAVNQEVCVTEQMANDAASLGRPGGGQPGMDCDRTQMRREGDALVGASTCRFQGQTTTTRFRLTGDLQSRYQMEVTSDSPGGPQTVRMDMTYAGPCSG